MIEHLIEIGRRRGGLSTSDLQTALPIDLMTMEEIAGIVAKLEDAGVPVEIDEALLSPTAPVPELANSNGRDPSQRELCNSVSLNPDSSAAGTGPMLRAGQTTSQRSASPARDAPTHRRTIALFSAGLTLLAIFLLVFLAL